MGVSTAQIASLAEGNKAIIAEQRETTKQVSEVKATLAAQQATAAATAEAVADLRSRVREVERR
jgi:cell division protein FtsB